MTTSPGLARKVQQLDNDVEAIYEMLTTIQVTQTRQHNRLVEIAEAQVEQGSTLDQHTAILAEHTATLAEHGSKLNRIIALLEAR
ncbi:MAG: hypothetical protein L0I24_02990 [Pseudonocardia sp.]|nr:hypothetical protein [Pseudonocardia sp.]